MKYLLVLAGNSVKNREWGEQCAEFFRADFDMVFFLQYDHWAREKGEFDLDTELEKIRETVAGAGEGEWYIFAKSIGSVLALKAVERGIITPIKCFFFGMSLNIAAKLYGEEWSYLTTFNKPALAFHNEADPTADYAFVSAKLDELAPTITLKTLSGNTHDYLDFGVYQTDIRQFLSDEWAAR